MIVHLYIGENKLDLFKEEQIELVQGVQDIRDITKTLNDYSKSFVVPATVNNNKIFKHYAFIGMDNSIDARVKISGRIDMGTLPFRNGYFQLNKVNIKNGQPFSYDLNFFGTLSELGVAMGEDLIEVLPVGAVSIPYSDVEVLYRLTHESNTLDNYIQYGMFSDKELIYEPGSSGVHTDETRINVSFDGPSGVDSSILWKEFYPSIWVNKLLQSIAEQYNIEFVSTPFLESDDFKGLYMLLNKPSNLSKVSQNQVTTRIDLQRLSNLGGGQYFNLVDDTITFTSEVRGNNRFDRFTIRAAFIPDLGSDTTPYTIKVWAKKNNGYFSVIDTIEGPSNTDYHRVFNNEEKITWTIYYEIIANPDFSFHHQTVLDYRWRHGLNHPINDDFYFVYTDNQVLVNTGNTVTISDVFPSIKVIDLLKGLILMFNLVLQNIGGNKYLLTTIEDYYSTNNTVKDFTKYADVKDYTITKAEAVSEYLFKFLDPQTKLNLDFKDLNEGGLGYGDLKVALSGNTGTANVKTEGTLKTIQVPFEQIVYERIKFPEPYTIMPLPIQAGGLYDTSFAPIFPKAHLHYNVPVTPGDIGIIMNNEKLEIGPNINMPHYSRALSVAGDFVGDTGQKQVLLFNKEFSTYDITGTFQVPVLHRFNYSLYDNFYFFYIHDINSDKTRIVLMNIRLPLREILKLELNDIIKVGVNHYRINKVTTNLNTGICAFELITII